MSITMIPLQRIVLSSDNASVTFSNIPSNFTDLYLNISARCNRASFNGDAIYITINGSTSNLSARYIQVSGSSITSGTETRYCGNMTAETAGANEFGSTEIYFFNYSGSSNKGFNSFGVGAISTGTPLFAITQNLWANSSAIDSISLVPSLATAFKSGSSFSLYGIRKS